MATLSVSVMARAVKAQNRLISRTPTQGTSGSSIGSSSNLLQVSNFQTLYKQINDGHTHVHSSTILTFKQNLVKSPISTELTCNV